MYINLEAELARKNITKVQVADVLKIDVTALSEKLTDPDRLELGEAFIIRNVFLPEFALDYLFKVAK